MKWRWIGGILGAFFILILAYFLVLPAFVVEEASEILPGNSKTTTGKEPPVLVTASGTIEATALHPASGTVALLTQDEKTYVRYENFETIGGPDLRVYLAKDRDAKEFIDLGPLRGTQGSLVYEIPSGVSPSDYPYVLVWCRAFGVLFNSAKLTSP